MGLRVRAGRALSGRRKLRALLVTFLAAGFAAVSLSEDVNLRTAARLPIWGSLTHRLAGYTADQKTPAFPRRIPVDAVQAAGVELRRGETYFVHTSGDSLEYTSLLSAARLYIPEAVPVARVGFADAVLSFNAPRVLPSGARAASTKRLGGGLLFIRLRR